MIMECINNNYMYLSIPSLHPVENTRKRTQAVDSPSPGRDQTRIMYEEVSNSGQMGNL